MGFGVRAVIWLSGMFAANVMMALLCFALYGICLGLFSIIPPGEWLARDMLEMASFPSFLLTPIFSGFVASFCWRRLQPSLGGVALGVLGQVMMILVGAAVILKEGIICLLIVAPLFYGASLAGALIGRVIFRKDMTKMRLSFIPLIAVAIVVEPLFRTPENGVVVDEILIKASPARVWPNLTSFPPIQTPPKFWMFKLGLPYPMETTSGGDYVGADRSCIFSDNMVFEEKVCELVTNENLTFDITKLPQHPELIGHITPYRGQFLLRDNKDGTTTLIGSTWYTVQVRPLPYFDWWTAQIFRAVHLRVMEDVKQRSEAL